MSTYNNSFSSFGRPLVPDDLCKDSAPRHSRFWRRRFLKVFTIYWHGGHLGQWTATILAIFCFPTQRWLHMKFEQNWLRAFRGEVVWNCQQFSHSNVWGSYKCIGKRTWPYCKKVKCQHKTILLAILVDLPSPMICAKIQPQGILGSGEEDFERFLYGHGGHLAQRTVTILAIFSSPTLRRLHMKFEQNWLRGFRGEVVWNSQHFSDFKGMGLIQMHREANLTLT